MTPTKTKYAAYLSVREVAVLRGVSRQRVYDWIRCGLPIADRINGGPIRILRMDAERYEPRPEGWTPGRKRPRKLSKRQLEKAAAKLQKKPTLARLAKDYGVTVSSLWQQLQELEREKKES